MKIAKNNLLFKGAKGKFGNAILYDMETTKGNIETIGRTNKGERRPSGSKAEVEANRKFKAVQSVVDSKLITAIKFGFRNVSAKGRQRTDAIRMNITTPGFVIVDQPGVGVNPETGEQNPDTFTVDMTNLQLSDGKLAGVENLNVDLTAGDIVWDDNTVGNVAESTDKLVLVLRNTDTQDVVMLHTNLTRDMAGANEPQISALS